MFCVLLHLTRVSADLLLWAVDGVSRTVSSRSDGELYICSVFFWRNSLKTSLVIGSLLFVAPVRRGIVLHLTRVSADLLLWAVDGVSRTAFWDQLVPIMATGNGQPEANRPSGDIPGRVHVPWSSRGTGVTLGSAGLYDLDTRYIPDVLGLCARRLEAAVVKVLSRKDNRCVRVLIPDENVGHQGFHDVLLHDMADADAPYVAVSDLSALRQERYCVTQIGLCTFCGKVIRLDLAKHVANYHLELAQLWQCPVSWCTIWKGTPQDYIDHILW